MFIIKTLIVLEDGVEPLPHFTCKTSCMFILLLLFPPQSGKFGSAPSDSQENQPQDTQYAEDAAEHENMKAVLKSSSQGGESVTSTVPGLRTRTRASGTRGQSQKHAALLQNPHNFSQ